MTIFIFVMAGILVGTAVWLGYQFAADKLHDDRRRLDQRRAALDAEWQALDQTRRLRELFFTASRAMRAEARRAMQQPDDGAR